MKSDTDSFCLNHSLSWDQLIDRLPGPMDREPPRKMVRTFYDSFDWRLYRAGTVLEEQRCDGESRILWRRLKSGAPLHQITGPVPRFAREFVPQSLRHRFESVMGVRAFLPRVILNSRVQSLNFRNNDGKSVVRLTLEENAVRCPGEKRVVILPHRVQIIPVEGHNDARRRLARDVKSAVSLKPSSDDVMVEALQAVGERPGDYTSKIRVPLSRKTSAAEALRVILLHLLNIMEANEAGVCSDVDPEFLHDFRVAVRRTRAALGQVKGVLPPEVLERFRPEFAWLGAITGPTRDLDVYLLHYDHYRLSLPLEFHDKLDPLRRYLVAQQKMEQATLAGELKGERYENLVREWRHFLESAQIGAMPVNGARPVEQVARERIWKVYRRTLKEGEAIHDASPAAELHELRKTCKKLRYLLEFFRSLFPADEIGSLIKALKVLQDNLGAFQDLQVQSTFLRRSSEEMCREAATGPGTLSAMGILVEKLEGEQRKARQGFEKRFRRFTRPEHARLFKKLFKPHIA